MLQFTHNFLPVAVGSFPHLQAEDALSLVFRHLALIPLWPQLPRRTFLENMYAQYSMAMPSVVVDHERERVFLDTFSQPEADLEAFYGRVLEEDLDYFAFPEEYAAGFWGFLSFLSNQRPGQVECLKGQVTGPFSFGLSVTDEKDRAIIYNQAYYEAVVASLAMHARWQALKLKELHPRVLIFIDEPYLVSFGSAFVSVDRQVVVNSINQVIAQIHQAGALAGVHCCGNTDWSLILETDLDLLNFDAYQFFENLILYVPRLQQFLQRGGMLAWGIVPSAETVAQVSVEALEKKLRGQLQAAEKAGLESDLIKRASLLSPACGLGSLSIPLAEEALSKLEELYLKLDRGT